MFNITGKLCVMTIKEAILKVLEDYEGSLTYLQVLDKIDEKNFIDWKNAKTPGDKIGRAHV